MAFEPAWWTRLELDGTPIYVRPDKPDWFVPNRAGDRVLRCLRDGEPVSGHFLAQRFLMRLPDDTMPNPYPGRAERLATDRLSELWLHITNRCNLTCSHCLFASSPDDASELPADRILSWAREASALGCRVFALTGGEPLVHGELETIVVGLLALPDARVVILTNGTRIRRLAATVEPWPRDRVHLQISIDGLAPAHDRVRGSGAFGRLMKEFDWLRAAGFPFTLSMCVMESNVCDMPGLVDLAAEVGAANVHFMWYFIRGRASRAAWPSTDEVFRQLCEAALRAEQAGVGLDNIDQLKSQVFAPPSTIYDGSSAGWDSVAIGPDGKLYPSPALVGIDAVATDIAGDLATAWRTSAVLEQVRSATAAKSDRPLRFLLGGGDADHSYVHAGRFVGDDPYEPLHERMALWLIAREAARQPEDGPPLLRLKMGDVLESCGSHGAVATVHSNCLLSLAHADGRSLVRAFYADAVAHPREDLRNPVDYPERLIEHIPDEARVRSYGCGSPVIDAEPQPGEVVVDLGCGTGVECLIASRLVGAQGRVIGVDMLDRMLEIARKGADAVGRRLGYRNVEFRKGYLEALPLDDACADLVLSNCVVNLSTNKRRMFAEIFRVLKHGGRLMISDVVCQSEPAPEIRNDDSLRGQCIAGALTERDLFGLLDESGFVSAYVVGRFPYRTVRGHPFFSMTFEAHKPDTSDAATRTVMYRGPAAALVTASGRLLPAGAVCRVSGAELPGARGEWIEFDEHGQLVGGGMERSACCTASEAPIGLGTGKRVAGAELPESSSCCDPSCSQQAAPDAELVALDAAGGRHMSGCMVCGEPLVYFDTDRMISCSYCGRTLPANAACTRGHFICDACHTESGAALIEHICLAASETDMIALLARIRRHPSLPMHGPDHHALVPGVILATYRNQGGALDDGKIRTGIRRGARMMGGACGLVGACGAALGVGIAFGIILGSNPVKAHQRQTIQNVVQRTLARIAAHEAARCCQRDCWLALRAAAELSAESLPIRLRAEAPLRCSQWHRNAECIGHRCPLWAPEQCEGR